MPNWRTLPDVSSPGPDLAFADRRAVTVKGGRRPLRTDLP